MNVLISSGGRRPYLTRWFKQALAKNDVIGRVVVADLDPWAPAASVADGFFVAPRVSAAEYAGWLGELLVAESIDLAISINDFELSVWSKLREQSPTYAPLLSLTSEGQAIAEDKAAMSAALARGHVPAPATYVASKLSDVTLEGGLVVKGRFGSGSRGLAFTDSAGLTEALKRARSEVTDSQGRPAKDLEAAADLTVVQPLIHGQEFGLDVVNDLNGRFSTVLARKKLDMRAGETDRATSVDATPFGSLARALSQVTNHRGLIDVDVLVDADGQAHVIDVNPRFGGGYPFSHLAGADIPAAYVAWAQGLRPNPEWLSAQPGISSAKYVDIAVAGA